MGLVSEAMCVEPVVSLWTILFYPTKPATTSQILWNKFSYYSLVLYTCSWFSVSYYTMCSMIDCFFPHQLINYLFDFDLALNSSVIRRFDVQTSETRTQETKTVLNHLSDCTLNVPVLPINQTEFIETVGK